MIFQEALMAFTSTVWGTIPEHFLPQSIRRDEEKINTAIELEHFCAPVVHPDSGETISKYQTLAKYPVTKETWTSAWGNNGEIWYKVMIKQTQQGRTHCS